MDRFDDFLAKTKELYKAVLVVAPYATITKYCGEMIIRISFAGMNIDANMFNIDELIKNKDEIVKKWDDEINKMINEEIEDNARANGKR